MKTEVWLCLVIYLDWRKATALELCSWHFKFEYFSSFTLYQFAPFIVTPFCEEDKRVFNTNTFALMTITSFIQTRNKKMTIYNKWHVCGMVTIKKLIFLFCFETIYVSYYMILIRKICEYCLHDHDLAVFDYHWTSIP